MSLAVKHVDCLIIGAGPTGLTLGVCLLTAGKSVLIVEKHETQLGYSRAILINSDTLEALEEYEMLPKLKESGILLDGFSFYKNDDLLSSAPFDTDSVHKFHPIALPQLVTENCLLERFTQLGGTMMRGVTFKPSDNQDLAAAKELDPLNITLQATDHQIVVCCQWLFGYDGVRSSVREALNIGFPGYSQSEERYIMDAQIESWPLPTHVSVWFGSSDARFVILISENPLIVRIVGTTPESCQMILNKFQVRAIVWDGSFTNSYRVAASYGRGRVWLAGDAAHVHSPIGGRGMNLGIQEAVALGRAVASDTVSCYEAQCRPVARGWVWFNFCIAQVVMSQNPFFQCTRMMLCGVFCLLGYVLGPRFAKGMFETLTTAKVSTKK